MIGEEIDDDDHDDSVPTHDCERALSRSAEYGELRYGRCNLIVAASLLHSDLLHI